MRLSIVIPSLNRMDILPETLDAIEAMDGASADTLEVVVVNDGSGPDTRAFLDSRRFTVASRILHQENAGAAAARKAGIEAASGPLIGLLGDDTVPEKGWLAAHLARHAASGFDPHLAVVGFTDWHPRMQLNPFLRFINTKGLQFGYDLIEDPDNLPFWFFYNSNITLHREMLLRQPPDLGMHHHAWEDIEVGYRLTTREALRMVYQPTARTAHFHPTPLSRFVARQETVGKGAVLFVDRHPELGPTLGIDPQRGPARQPPALLCAGLTVLAKRLEHTPLPLPLPLVWKAICRCAYLRGLHHEWATRANGAAPPAEATGAAP